jgi:hypothetical protein
VSPEACCLFNLCTLFFYSPSRYPAQAELGNFRQPSLLYLYTAKHLRPARVSLFLLCICARIACLDRWLHKPKELCALHGLSEIKRHLFPHNTCTFYLHRVSPRRRRLTAAHTSWTEFKATFISALVVYVPRIVRQLSMVSICVAGIVPLSGIGQ